MVRVMLRARSESAMISRVKVRVSSSRDGRDALALTLIRDVTDLPRDVSCLGYTSRARNTFLTRVA